eukprot:1154157-Pelagomonas_calceolata.AAC.5
MEQHTSLRQQHTSHRKVLWMEENHIMTVHAKVDGSSKRAYVQHLASFCYEKASNDCNSFCRSGVGHPRLRGA